jgi:hypothetical protein
MEYTENELSEIVNNLHIFKSWDFVNKTILGGILNGITLKMLIDQENNIDNFVEYQVRIYIEYNDIFITYKNSNTRIVNRFYQPLLFKVVNNMKYL